MKQCTNPSVAAASWPLLVMVALLGGCIRTPQPEDPLRFERLDEQGLVVADATREHHCVRDRATTLEWAVHRPGHALLDAGHRYSWYSSDKTAHSGDPGLLNGGNCALPRCDTEALVAAVNQAGLCGQSDWRLPSREESIALGKRHGDVQFGLNPRLFPHSGDEEFWTATTFRLYAQSAWALDPATGLDRADLKTAAKPVRLVRGTMALAQRRK